MSARMISIAAIAADRFALSSDSSYSRAGCRP
jgi:hypothetical protein